MNVQNIVEFAVFLWGDTVSAAQLTLLRVLYGLPLTREERALWRRFAGKGIFARYVPREYAEGVAILGRQSGKSSRIGVTVSLFEALVVPHQVPEGERLAVLFFTPTLRQSTFDQVSEKIRSVPELAQFIENDTSAAGEIRLTNGIDLVGFSANPRTARGRAAILCIVDEAAFIRTDSSFEMNLPELLESIRPSLVVHRGKLLLLSSPSSGKEGILYDAWEGREANAAAVMVWRAPSPEMNPAIDKDLLKRERDRGESYYAREYLAEFTEAANPFLPTAALEAAIARGKVEFSSEASDYATVAGIDLADKRDDCALCISTVREVAGKRKVVVLLAKLWKPSRDGHVVPRVLEEMGVLCKAFGVGEAKGDQKSMSTAEYILGRYGVSFVRTVTDGAGSEQMYRTFLGALNNGDIVLPENEELLGQLRRLEERTGDGNRFRVAGRRNAKDDLAVAAVLSTSMAVENLGVSPEPMTEYLELYTPDGDPRLWQKLN
jgi:hypothetical protein